MTTIKRPLLSPIRFYDPNLSYGSATTFQNPDNRVSHGYNWEGVNPIPYALPIPKQWPDYQPGIDFMINIVQADGTFYAHLYDKDNVYYKSLYVQVWKTIGTDKQYRVFLDGVSGTGIADGYYTIKLFQTSDDALLYESEPLLIGSFFDDEIPFECWNFESDFGIAWDNGNLQFTFRMMMPIRIFDPVPIFEKEIYQNDPGVLTTLRTIPQRVFNFDSLPVPAYVTEIFAMAFANSELYLDRIKINAEDAPESELIEGSHLKQITGQATLVDFNDTYMREKVETALNDESIDWSSHTYSSATITGNSIDVNTNLVSGTDYVNSQSYVADADEMVLVKLVLTDDDGESDLPSVIVMSIGEGFTPVEWGTHWYHLKFNTAGTKSIRLQHSDGEKAVYTAVITFYSIS